MANRHWMLLLLLPLAHAAAAERAPPRTPAVAENPALLTTGFLSAHPDLRFRLLGMQAKRRSQDADALKYFQRAAFYGDKPSQGMVAEMFWTGQGAAQDRALAYAWMDLAAERGYRGFVGLRERYWRVLDAPERTRAIALGGEVYARYGDAAALPRIAVQLRRGRSQMTGSRTGFAGSTKIYVPGPLGMEEIDASKFYDPRYWDPILYQQWHDAIWRAPRIGRVAVGEAEQALEADADGLRSRVPATRPEIDAPEPEAPDLPEGAELEAASPAAPKP